MKTVELIAAVGFVAIVIVLSGCGVMSSPPTGDGHIMIAADERGMRAFGDTLNGMITNGKASPDQDTAHWTTRRAQEVEATKRGGFWGKLTNNEKQGS